MLLCANKYGDYFYLKPETVEDEKLLVQLDKMAETAKKDKDITETE